MSMHGKWSQEGVPHKGWTCVGVDDLEAPDQICDMCETREIRYVHRMSHPDYPNILEVGCVCAEKMENDYEEPKRRERALRSAAGRRERWLGRRWKVSLTGSYLFLMTDGFKLTIFENSDGTWSGTIEDWGTARKVSSQRLYESEDAAKFGAFNGMIFLKAKKGWGS